MGTEDTPPADGPTSDQARGWLEAVRRDLRELELQLAPLHAERDRLRARELLLGRLVQSFEPGTRPERVAGADASGTPPPVGAIGEYIVEQAAAILKEIGQPMHINDLHAQFVARRLFVPGAGTPANLTAHLRRGGRISSPERGIYALVSEESEKPAPKKKKRRSRRRRGKK